MKKLFILCFSLLAVTLFTACGNDDEPVNKQTVSMTVNNRAIDGETVVFSQNNAMVEVNYPDRPSQINTEYTDVTERPPTLTSPTMSLANEGGSIYSFGKGTTSDMTGYIDFATGMTWFIIHDNSGTVVSTSQLLYAYSTTTVTNPDNGNHFSHEHSAYLFAIDSECQKCYMRVSNFIPNIAGSVEAGEIQFNNLTVTPTPTGYTVTAAEAEANNKSYTITDLSVELSDQCQIINGSFKCKDLEFTITGKIFPNVSYVPF